VILLVEDEEILRFTFSAFLTGAGYQVKSAATFREGIALMQNEPISLVISDIILPDGNGIDILKAVKKDGTHSCPVIMITGQPGVETASQSVRNGAYDYLVKPVTKDALLRVVKNAYDTYRSFEENKKISLEKDGLRRDLETIFSSVQEGIVTVDCELRIVRVNQAMERICGCVTEKSVGKPLAEAGLLCSKSCLQELQKALSSKDAPPQQHQIECRRKGREEQVVMLTSSPLMGKDNECQGAVLVVHDITQQKSLENELHRRQQYGRLIGGSGEMQRVYGLLDNLRGSTSTVLITGESGTGKELVASELHYGSSHSPGPFVRVNCSSLSDSLLESELFGHVRGAFTGAVEDKKGRFERADGGTILLDEIGDISLTLQLKLLRVLQEHEIERVGGTRPIPIDVRVLAATNKDLQEQMHQHLFREDLYYRLKVVGVHLPPLRARTGDIPLLLDHFLKKFRVSTGKNIRGFSDEAQELLARHHWPGNVRELEHAIEHGFVLCQGTIITRKHLPPEICEQRDVSATIESDGEKITVGRILEALEKTAGNKARAARLLGISRRTIYRKLDPSEDH
jgi:two-component system response regulator HydG